MRASWTIAGILLSACLSVTSADANPRGAVPPGHSKPQLTGKPNPAGKPTTLGKPMPAKSGSPRMATTTTPHLNPIAAKIASKPQLASRLTQMLPPGMTLNQASRGFKNQGQFIAALHVSRNLGIPFRELRRDMTVKHLSLGQSIQDLKRSSNAPTEARRAERQADDDVKSASRLSKKDVRTDGDQR